MPIILNIIWAIIVPTENNMVYLIMIDGHSYDGNHLNGIIDLTDKGISVRQ